MKPTDFPDYAARVQALHDKFEALTGFRVTLSYLRIEGWREFMARGYGEAEIELVVRWLRSQMGKPGTGFTPQSLQFSRLIQDTDLFEDRLNLAQQARSPRRRPATERREIRAGDTSTLVDSRPAEEPIEVRNEVLGQFDQLKRDMQGGSK